MRPRPIARVALIGLVAILAVVTFTDESWAAFSGGSRLLYYYTQRSIVNASAPAGSANTIIGITNQSNDTAVNVRIMVFNGSSCASFGPVTQNLSPRRTLRLAINSLVTAATFPEGYVDVWAVNAGGSPLRWDQLAGKGTILDFGGANTAAVTYEAAALFSDADRVTGTSSQQGQLITTNGDGKTWGALEGSLEFWGLGGSFGTNHRLVVIPVSTNPGEAPAATSPNIRWHKTDGSQTRNADVAMPCMIANSLVNLHPAFAANYPNDGSLTQGGNLDISSDGNKGIVGALFETGTTPALLGVHSLQHFTGVSKESHE